MSPTRLIWITFALTVPLATLVTGCGQDVNAPPRGVNPIGAENYKSDLSASVRFLHKDLATNIDRALPKSYSGNASLSSCQAAQAADCNGITSSLNITRSQAIVITKGAQPNSMNVAVPITANGTIKSPLLTSPVNYDLGALLKLTVLADIAPDWCPKLTINGTYEWTQPARIEVRPGTFVNISTDQTASLQQLIQEVNTLIGKEINCAEVQKQASNIWAKRDIAVDVEQMGAMHLHVAPESIKLIDSIASEDSLDFAFFVSGQLNLSKTEQPTQPQALPALMREATSANGQLTAKLPLVIDYASIDRELNKVLQQTAKIVVSTGVGTAEVTLKQIMSYPSFDDIVVVIHFYADVSGALPSTNGLVYLLVTPTLEAGGKTLKMTNVRVATTLSNDIYRALNLELSKSIRKKIDKYLVFDATKEIEKLVEMINKQLTSKSEALSMNLKLQDPTLGMVKVALTENGVLLVSQFTTTPQVTLPVAAALNTKTKQN